MRKLITILVPAYNEEEALPYLMKRLYKVIDSKKLSKYDFELLFVDDGSKDNTLELIMYHLLVTLVKKQL